jgi:hypothetical protein
VQCVNTQGQVVKANHSSYIDSSSRYTGDSIFRNVGKCGVISQKTLIFTNAATQNFKARNYQRYLTFSKQTKLQFPRYQSSSMITTETVQEIHSPATTAIDNLALYCCTLHPALSHHEFTRRVTLIDKSQNCNTDQIISTFHCRLVLLSFNVFAMSITSIDNDCQMKP